MPVAEEFRTGSEMSVDDFAVLLRQQWTRSRLVPSPLEARTLGGAGAAETAKGVTSEDGARTGADKQGGGR